MRRFVRLAALCGCLAATAAMAAHPAGSPGNPKDTDGWKELGHLDADAASGVPGRTVYLNIQRGQPAWSDQHHMTVDIWHVLDEPFVADTGTATETEYVYDVDCIDGTFSADPEVLAYGADGTPVFRHGGTPGSASNFDDAAAGSLGEIIALEVCT